VQILVETRSLSWAESVRLALLGEGIEAVVLDQASAGTLGLMGSIRVVIPDDADIARASEIVAALQPPKTPPLPSWWWHKRALLAFAAGLVLSRVAMGASDTPSMSAIEWLLIVATVVCLLGAIVLMVAGYRADSAAGKSPDGVGASTPGS
jgi:hypothetical protein